METGLIVTNFYFMTAKSINHKLYKLFSLCDSKLFVHVCILILAM